MHVNTHKVDKNEVVTRVTIHWLLSTIAAIFLVFGAFEMQDHYLKGLLFIISSLLLLYVSFSLSLKLTNHIETNINPLPNSASLNFWPAILSFSLLPLQIKLGGVLTNTLVYWVILTILVILLTFHISKFGFNQLIPAKSHPRKALIVGTSTSASLLAQKLRQSPSLNIELQGFIETYSDSNPDFQGILLGTTAELPDYVKHHKIDVVYIALGNHYESEISELVAALKDTTTCVYIVPTINGLDITKSRFYNINGVPIFSLWENPFSTYQSALKRTIDIVGSIAGLILLSPVFLCIAVLVKISSPGPILFKQRRYGINGQQITVYKFRTMTVMEDGESVTQASQQDPRVTKLGSILRRTSLDELPQLINVLQGAMSLVGPRPHACSHNEKYRKLIKGYMLRHKVKPGITGWAQVHGLRGETDTLDKMEKRVEYDFYYLQNWSLELDLFILFKTFGAILSPTNAY